MRDIFEEANTKPEAVCSLASFESKPSTKLYQGELLLYFLQ